MRTTSIPLLTVTLLGILAACSATDREGADPGGSLPGPPDSGSVVTDGAAPGDGGPGKTEVGFPVGTKFDKRSCNLRLRYKGTAGSVKVAGEFTDWATSPVDMTRTGDGFSVDLAPGPKLEAGKLYGYKLIIDGNWTLDPDGKYRKIVADTMNSGLQLPTCAAGPELLPEKLTSSAAGDAKVRVRVATASDGDAPTRIIASLDKAAVEASALTFDAATGSVEFAFRGLPKGKHTLSLGVVDGKQRSAEPIDLPFWVEDEAFDYRDGILYMFMIDRYANGNRTNDAPVGGAVHYDADWHGGDMEGALKVLESGYFEKLGVRTIWLSPLNKQTSKSETGDGNQLYSAYHGYWPTKAREVEPRFGGEAPLKAFVAAAHKRGMRVLLDLINNQVHKDHEYVAPHGDWFRQSCKCGDDANQCGWSQRPFDCMFQSYLPDINWKIPGAEKQFTDDAVFWIKEFDFDGFRVDAVKHVESNSIYNMRAELTRRFEQSGGRIFMVGETAVGENDRGNFFGEQFNTGYEWIDAYTGQNGLDGQFDFPTRHNMADGLCSGQKPLNEVEAEIRKAETRYRPGNRHVRFLNGHDNPRIASIAAQDPKLGCSWASGCRDGQLPPLAYTNPAVYTKLRRALTVLYSLPGVPYLYAGDEVAFGGGGDPDMRRNMLFGESDLAAVQMAKQGSQPASLIPEQIALRDWVRKLGAARASSKAMRRGERITLIGGEADLWVYAYQSGPKEVAVVAINRGGAVSRTIPAGALQVGGISTFTSPLGVGTATKAGENLTLSLGAGEAAIFLGQ